MELKDLSKAAILATLACSSAMSQAEEKKTSEEPRKEESDLVSAIEGNLGSIDLSSLLPGQLNIKDFFVTASAISIDSSL